MVNLKTALKSSPQNIELAFEPFFDDKNDEKATTPRGSFTNANALASALSGKRAAVFTIQFGFHSGGTKSTDAPSDAVLRYRAASFYKNFYKAYRKKADFVLCPSLEDEWVSQSTWTHAAEIMLEGFLSAAAADKLTADDIGNISVRRSSNDHGDDVPKKVTGNAYVTKTVGNKPKTVLAFTKDFTPGGELHGFVTSKSVAYSNDGQVVYASSEGEDDHSMKNASGEAYANQYDLADWIVDTDGKTTPVLLWRPGYNCYARETEVVKKKDVLKKPIRYIAADRGSRFDKQTNGQSLKSGPVFGSTEINVAKAFFAGPSH